MTNQYRFPINKELYCQFLIAAQKNYTITALADILENQPAHDSFTRWLKEVKLKPRIIWEYAKSMVEKDKGFLIIDDTVLDKFFGKEIEPVCKQYSGRHHRQVYGIGVINLIWTNQSESIPIDFRLYDKLRDGKDKNQHCRQMLNLAYQRAFRNITVLMDSAYSGGENLKLIEKLGWKFVVGIKKNRIVRLSLSEKKGDQVVNILQNINEVTGYINEFGHVKIIKLIRFYTNEIDYVATNDLTLSFPVIKQVNARRWKVEEFHRGEKQITGIESCQFRDQRAQRNHVFCSILAFLAIEKHRLEHGISWYQSKHLVIADALRAYLKKPFVRLPQNAST